MSEAIQPKRDSSRNVVVAAVAVLIVVAIAGIVLASINGRPTPAAATRSGVAAAASGDVSSSLPVAGSGPNEILFAADSEKLPDGATAKLARIAEAARPDKRTVVIALSIEALDNKAAALEVARNRGQAIRNQLVVDGVPIGTIRLEIAQMPRGLLPARDVGRAQLSLR